MLYYYIYCLYLSPSFDATYVMIFPYFVEAICSGLHLPLVFFSAGGCLDSILAGGRAAQADHRDAQGHVGPLGGRVFMVI